jgi:endonuclease/exonuclease/phosphatase family metal-dependent hydrolase
MFDWQHRFALQCDRLQTHAQTNAVDLFCLQEMQDTAFDAFRTFFKALGFSGVFQESDHDYPVGCAVFWRTDTLQLVRIEHRSRAIVCTFQWRDQFVYVVCAHLEGNMPNVYKGAKRVEQTVSSLKRVQAMMKSDKIEQDKAKVIVCGDFNAMPTEELYKFMVEGGLPAMYEQSLLSTGNLFVKEAGPSAVVTKAAVSHPFKFVSSYAAVHSEEPVYTFVGNDEAYTLDYAFVQNLRVVDAQLGHECMLPAPIGAIPDDARPSDHLDMLCVFESHVADSSATTATSER